MALRKRCQLSQLQMRLVRGCTTATNIQFKRTVQDKQYIAHYKHHFANMSFNQ